MAVGDRPNNKPEWASSGSADKTQPTANREDTGWIYGEAVPNDVFNWWMWNVWMWIEHLDDLTGGQQGLIDILDNVGAAMGEDDQSIFEDLASASTDRLDLFLDGDGSVGTATTTQVGADELYSKDGAVITDAASLNVQNLNRNPHELQAGRIVGNESVEASTFLLTSDGTLIGTSASPHIDIRDGGSPSTSASGDLAAASISASEVLASSRLQTDGRVETDVLRGDANDVIDVENDTGGGGGLNVSILEDSGDGEITVRDQNQNNGRGELYAKNTAAAWAFINVGGGSASVSSGVNVTGARFESGAYYIITISRAPAGAETFAAHGSIVGFSYKTGGNVTVGEFGTDYGVSGITVGPDEFMVAAQDSSGTRSELTGPGLVVTVHALT